MEAERTWLAWVRRTAAPGEAVARRRGLRLGIGDDAALLRPRRGWELALTTDLMVEDVHFVRGREAAASIGHRLATRALSDLAAMGAEPLALLVSSAYPAGLPPAWPRQMTRGLVAAAAAAGAALAGGDVSASPPGVDKIILDVAGVGQAPAGRALRRRGARPGDRLFVSGRLGEAARGRELVQAGAAVRGAEDRQARARHLHPRARWELGQALRGRATAAIDLSDGLATDLRHLCQESGVGAEIVAEALPARPEDAGLRRALFGGEDYELLFTLPPGAAPPAAHAHAVRAIGHITAVRGLWLRRGGRRHPLPDAGWEHWRK